MNTSVRDVNRLFETSDLMALRQCPKRLWLEAYCPALKDDALACGAVFSTDSRVAVVARAIYDPDGSGEDVDRAELGLAAAVTRTQALLNGRSPIFAAVFCADGVSAFVDVLLPVTIGERRGWRAIEVKAATRIRDYRRDEVAIQIFVMRAAGVDLTRFSVTTIDSGWTYAGDGNYAGLFKEWDLSLEASGRRGEVKELILQAASLVSSTIEPDIAMGAHCTSPYRCHYCTYCETQRPQAEFPVAWLPRQGESKALRVLRDGPDAVDMRDVPDEILTLKQRRAKDSSVHDTVYFDCKEALSRVRQFGFPATFIDFETIGFAVPRWAGLRPFQMIPFQFSSHILGSQGTLVHKPFLDLSGADPSMAFARALLVACADQGPVFVYNAQFENEVISELADRFPELAERLLGISARSVDLLPIARDCYYHPKQRGSWSLKNVLPAIAPELGYDSLEGVRNGAMAMDAYAEAVDGKTSAARKAQLHAQLLQYCKLDTLALVRLWQMFAGRRDLELKD